MSRTAAEGLSFVRASRFSIGKFYEVLELRRNACEAIRRQIDEILRREQDEHKWYMDWGQWEAAGNHEFFQYMKRVEQMTARRAALADGAIREETLRRLLAEAGASDNAIGIAAGAVLQVGKQALSYRFGAKGSLPSVGGRHIGSQPVFEVIWEGRNHALHWEESKPGTSAAMLLRLQADGLLKVKTGENQAVDLLDVLNWTQPGDMLTELEALVAL